MPRAPVEGGKRRPQVVRIARGDVEGPVPPDGAVRVVPGRLLGRASVGGLVGRGVEQQGRLVVAQAPQQRARLRR